MDDDDKLVTIFLEFDEYDEGKINDARHSATTRIQDLEARIEAMTRQHEAALEAVGEAREAALREAAAVCNGSSWLSMGIRDEILALINKGDSNA